jgi:transcriptional regulator GlxA family with amidase domain
MTTPRTLGVLLFPDFELLDVFGPLEVFGNARVRAHFAVSTVAEAAGPVASGQGVRAFADYGLEDCPPLDLLLVPGGFGTRREVENARLLDWLGRRAAAAELTMSVCTGAALLARAGVLDGRRATTNKRVFQWVAAQGPRVDWVPVARWVDDGTVITSAGVSAGIDMALHVVGRLTDAATADQLAAVLEYDRHRDAAWDPFAKIHGLA